jgi:hypothetical protein
MEYCRQNSTCPDAGKLIKFKTDESVVFYVVLNYQSLFYVPNLNGHEMSEDDAKKLSRKDIVNKIK